MIWNIIYGVFGALAIIMLIGMGTSNGYVGGSSIALLVFFIGGAIYARKQRPKVENKE